MTDSECPLLDVGCDGLMAVSVPKWDGRYGLVDASSYGPVVKYEFYESRASNGMTLLGSVPGNPAGDTLWPGLLVKPVDGQYSILAIAYHASGAMAHLQTSVGQTPAYGWWYRGLATSGQRTECGVVAAPVEPVASRLSGKRGKK